MAKISKLNNDKKTKNKKKKKTSGPKALAMKLNAPKANPFESIWSRRKFDVLGKKRKGEERRIGLARSHAIEKRKKTLLKEYEQSGKASVFVDKRIGEHDEELGEFDKAILRSQRQRKMKQSKRSKFNLSDGEEDDDFGNQSLGALSVNDDFQDELLPDDDYDSEDGDAETKKAAALQGGLTYYDTQHQPKSGLMEGEENKRKSKKEVMDEIIAKSKFFKAQKSKDKEENEQLVEELDKKFESLVQSESLLSITGAGNSNALKDSLPATGKTKNFSQDKADAFDKLVIEMAMEIRARPSDRTKAPEEIAQEERERLELLEEERQKRMLATDNSSDEEYEDADSTSVRKLKHISGDDLGDSFSVDNEARPKKGWVDEILERKNADDNESEDDDSAEDLESDDDEDVESEEDSSVREVNLSMKDWEQSDDDILDTNLEEDDEASEGEKEQDENHAEEKEIVHVNLHKERNSAAIRSGKSDGSFEDTKRLEKDTKRQTKQELPYIIEAPESFEQFSSLLNDCSNSDIILIIGRIRTSNAIKLAETNLEKMQRFYGILLQYFAVLANKKPLNVELLNLLVKPLMEMSMEIPFYAATCARIRISHTHKQFCLQNKNPENSLWPSSKSLILLRLWSMIYPCSDYRHVVITPAMLLMCEYLIRCTIVTGRDIAIGSFLCSLLLSVAKQSLKFCPEAINFLHTVLSAAVDRRSLSSQNPQQICHLVELKALGPLLHIQNPKNEISPLNFFMMMDLSEDSSFFSSDNFRAGLLLTVVEAIDGFVNVYGRLNAFPEIFLPISTILLELAQQDNMPDLLQAKFRNVAKVIEAKTEEHYMGRLPLKMRKQKAVPIKLLNPKFEENFVKGRDYDPDRERVERRKLQKLVKREVKGAARELRKDNNFLFEVKAKEKRLEEEERAEKYGKARAFLQEQEQAFKSGLLGKGGKKRRR